MSTQPLKSSEEKKSASKIKLNTPIGNILVDKKELEEKFGCKIKIITLIILITLLMIMILNKNIVISHVIHASNIA